MILSPEHVDFVHKRVSGYAPVQRMEAFGNWKKVNVPLPDAIYENVFVHLAVQGKAIQLRREARRLGIPLFNPLFPSKWQFHRMLHRHTNLDKHLPRTQIYLSPKDTLRCIEQSETVYVKPIGGYGGCGVMRIEPLGNGQYRVSTDRTVSKAVNSGASCRVPLDHATDSECWYHRV